jgi:predicted metal-dependent hydrolase
MFVAMTDGTVRKFDRDLTSVPKHWVADNAVATAIANGINLLFPEGERFFVRSVNHFVDQITDAELRAQIKVFFGQEGRHARAHDEFAEVMRAQGFRIDGFLAAYYKIGTSIERAVPAKLNLACTAAAEHFTAMLAHRVFNGGLDGVDPHMRDLVAWHAAEEIEHKAVAFDVLRAVDPSYTLRMAGLAYATVMLGGFWLTAAAMLIAQERLGRRAIKRQLGAMRERSPLRRVFVAGIRRYMRRDFHPNQVNDRDLAAAWYSAHGLHMPEAA